MIVSAMEYDRYFCIVDLLRVSLFEQGSMRVKYLLRLHFDLLEDRELSFKFSRMSN